MKNKLILLFLLLGNLCLLNSQTVHSRYIDGSIYLKLRDTCGLELTPYNYSNLQLNIEFAKYGVLVPMIRKPFPDVSISLGLSKIYHLHCTDSIHVDSCIAHLEKIPIVEYAEKEPLLQTFYTPNDVNGNQWYLSKIEAANAWNFTHGSPTIVIAIVDNAIRITHADLVTNIWTNPGEIPNNFFDDDLNGYVDDIHGYDVADHDNNPNPPSTVTNLSPFVHGTHCAGIASAATDNSKGIASLGFNTKIMAVKCTSDKETGATMTNAYDGVYYAMKAHANIISMSWGGTGAFLSGQNVINTASQMGIVLIAAAGNEDSLGVDYPAAYSNVIAVGSTDIDDIKSGFSNYGTAIDVMAPGTGIYSTLAGDDNSYGYLSGTSMATPMVAGLAALVKAANPAFTPLQIENAIKAGCDNINGKNPSLIGKLGAGRINAYRTFKPNAGVSPVITKDNLTEIDITPNPASGVINYTIYCNSPGEMTLYLLNALGQMVEERKKVIPEPKTKGALDIAGLPKGIYYLEVVTNTSLNYKKIIVE